MQKSLFGISLLMLLAITTAFTNFEDILDKLALDQKYANEVIMTRVVGLQEFRVPYVKTLPEIISGDKVGAAKELFTYVKQYCESAEFASAYAKQREAAKPDKEDPPMYDKETLDMMKESAKSYEELSKDKNQPAESRAQYKKMADEWNQNIAMAADPTPKKTKWEKEYPADPAKAVTNRLNEYLKILGTVDFNAQLTAPDKYKKKKFVNSEYEKKPNEWKAIYRAGKEVNDAVGGMVRDWLKTGVKTGQAGPPPSASKAVGSDEPAKSGTEAELEKSKLLQKPSFKSMKEKLIPKKNG